MSLLHVRRNLLRNYNYTQQQKRITSETETFHAEVVFAKTRKAEGHTILHCFAFFSVIWVGEEKNIYSLCYMVITDIQMAEIIKLTS